MCTADRPRMPIEEVTHIAAYGTLRSNHGNHTRSGMAEHVTSVGIYQVPAIMYAVPNTGYAGQDGHDYPGAVFHENATPLMEIELFAITGDRKQVLALLDSFENDAPDNPEYRRIIINIAGIDAYIYEYIKPVDGLPQIISGIWPNVRRYGHGHASLRFNNECERWACPACGASGLDGEDSPSDFACRTR